MVLVHVGGRWWSMWWRNALEMGVVNGHELGAWNSTNGYRELVSVEERGGKRRKDEEKKSVNKGFSVWNYREKKK
jgi:hypothetical protein